MTTVRKSEATSLDAPNGKSVTVSLRRDGESDFTPLVHYVRGEVYDREVGPRGRLIASLEHLAEKVFGGPVSVYGHRHPEDAPAVRPLTLPRTYGINGGSRGTLGTFRVELS